MKNTNKAKILSLMLTSALLLNGCASKDEVKNEETLGSSRGIQEYLGNFNGRNYYKLFNSKEEHYFVEMNKGEWTEISESEYLEVSRGISRKLN